SDEYGRSSLATFSRRVAMRGDGATVEPNAARDRSVRKTGRAVGRSHSRGTVRAQITLAPKSVPVIPTASAAIPSTRDPPAVSVGRDHPAAWNPVVVVAHPAPVSAYPHVVESGRRGDHFDAIHGRSTLDVNTSR